MSSFMSAGLATVKVGNGVYSIISSNIIATVVTTLSLSLSSTLALVLWAHVTGPVCVCFVRIRSGGH